MADKKAIQNRLVAYFAWRLDKPASWFSRDTPVRKAFINDEDWIDLANHFNKANWMKAIGAKLDPRDMRDVSTIGELTDLIASHAGNRVKRLTPRPSTTASRPAWLA